MSGVCGWVGDAPAFVLDAMLDAIPYRGDATDTWAGTGFALGYRWWRGRPGKSPGIHRAPSGVVVACAGTLVPRVDDPAAQLAGSLDALLPTIDGAFAAARWDPEAAVMTLMRDPFGVRSLYVAERPGVVLFASELKQLLASGLVPREVDPTALHKYLTFSFVPGDATPIKGVRRLLPGHTLKLGRGAARPYFVLEERVDPALEVPAAAVRAVRTQARRAVRERLVGEQKVGLYLSGGLDSSSVAVWLREAGADVRAFSLDFGTHDVEGARAREVAARLEMPLEPVKVGGADLIPVLDDLVSKLDLPFGDAVTGPQYLLGRAARAAGMSAVFNGEGGDQLFGGWTAKPMVAAGVYASAALYEDDALEATPEQQYLQTYHRFYGLESQLYSPSFLASIGGPGQRRALLTPYLSPEQGGSFLSRVRLADISLKGSQNILPRAERLSNAFALDLRVPLFDRALAETSFRLPPSMKLHGATEKYVLKLAMRKKLPEDIVWRRKLGMSVPITDWLLGPLAPVVADRLGADALARRGFFNERYVKKLRDGQNDPAEPRRRRVGEKLWALLMLESWLRVFIDGAKP